MKIKIGDAFSMMPSNASAPSGGCNQRQVWPRVIVDPTAMRLAKSDVPK